MNQMHAELPIEKRFDIRAPLGRKVLVVTADGQKEHGKIKDISINGAGMLLLESKRIGQNLIISFRLPTHTGHIDLKLTCKVIHNRIQHNVHYVGIRFVGLDPKIEGCIRAFVNYKLR